MIVVELAFTADPHRIAARPAHRRRLAGLHAAGLLFAAGPWADDSGALLVFRTGEAEVTRELATDPYYSTGGVRVTALRAWSPLVGPSGT